MKAQAALKIPHFSVNETTGKYKSRRPLTEEQILKASYAIIKNRVKSGFVMNNIAVTGAYLREAMADYEHEVFACLFLDNRHRLIKFEEMFRGTIDSASVHPREVVKRALQLNAAAIVLAHNHPSGDATPSQADKCVTSKIQEALSLIDIRLLDHFIIGVAKPFSFAEKGLI